MGIELKVQCLAIDAPQERSYDGRKWWERSLQCITMDKVFVYRSFAASGETPEAKAEQKALADLKAGEYMADLDFRQGDGAKATFIIQSMRFAGNAKQTQST